MYGALQHQNAINNITDPEMDETVVFTSMPPPAPKAPLPPTPKPLPSLQEQLSAIAMAMQKLLQNIDGFRLATANLDARVKKLESVHK